MNIARWLHSSAMTSPDRPALLTGTHIEANYREFTARVASIAFYLQDRLNIAAGDRVAILMANRTEYLEVLYAIWWIGAIVVPINARLHEREVAWIIDDAEACALFVGDDTMPADFDKNVDLPYTLLSVDSAEFKDIANRNPISQPVDRTEHDIAWLFYTSGTTGSPKGVMLSHGNLVAMSLCYLADVDTAEADDAYFYAAPISHGAGLYNIIHVRCAARHVMPPSRRFDAQEIISLAPQLKNVTIFAAPTMVKRLIDASHKADYRGDGIKTIIYGGGPMYRADITDALHHFGNRFAQIYGQGESPMTITALAKSFHSDIDHPRYQQRLGSVGIAQSAVEVRITGKNCALVATGKPGEIEVRGTTIMLGYWKNPQATEDTICDGWLKTGDIGSLDEDGFLTLTDRSKDIIISGGANIYPREVEEVLLAHPGVDEASVIGASDAEWGEKVVAFIVGDNIDVADLDRWCLDHIARFKRPKDYHLVERLPKNSYGKVLKTELRTMQANMPE